MNVFVLCTGRSGSSTFIAACQHMRNFTAGHESRARVIGAERLRYPTGHIEADNRLSWLLGRLDAAYGDNAFYVHLKRDDEQTAASFLKRWNHGIIGAYHRKIVLGTSRSDRMAICLDYCETVNRNIELFLRNKTSKMTVQVESIEQDYLRFWEAIGAEGDVSAALAEVRVRHNASTSHGKGVGGRWANAFRIGRRAG